MSRPKTIDAEFFRRYAGSNKSYKQVYREHSYLEECIALFESDDAPRVRSICVLGTATGEVLKDIHKGFGVKAYGCEISEWAFNKTPRAYRARIRCEDMRLNVARHLSKKKIFDLTFANSLVYLPPRELPTFLRSLARMTRYFHFRSSFAGEACADPYRRILESYEWWNRRLESAGFKELRTTFGAKSYLWVSTGQK